MRLTWIGRSPAWRAAAIVAAAGLVAMGWYLGSPLFIRTSLHEDLPRATVAPATATVAVAQDATAAPTTVASPSNAPTVVAEGNLQFVDRLHNGTGAVRVVNIGPQRLLRFDDVAITNAPDVHVYLSKETGGKWSEATSLYVGPLKATNGSFNYDLPSADLSVYKSVVVWCRAFSVLVTWADLTRD